MVLNRALNNILNNSTSSTNSTEEEIDEMVINEIHELKSIVDLKLNSSGNAIRNLNIINNNNNNNNNNINNLHSNNQNQHQNQHQQHHSYKQMENLDNDDDEDDSLEIDSQPSSPQKKFKSSCDDFEIITSNNNTPTTTTTTTANIITTTPNLKNNNHNNNNNNIIVSPNLNISSSLIPTTPFSKKLNFDHVLSSCKNDQPLPIPQQLQSTWVVNANHLKKFEKSEQEVASIESDEDEEFDEYDDDDEFDDDEFSSRFDEMKKSNGILNQHNNNNNNNNNNINNNNNSSNGPAVNGKLQIFNYQQQLYGPNGTHNNGHHVPSTNTTPMASPKSNPGTPSRPFPTLDYKIKSESVKQNADGTYSCPYPTCNKTIKGNKGNLSSHLRWHRRLDAEAGELRDSNPIDEGEEEFTTPIKPSQRGVQLRNQMIRYGLNLFRQDSQGKYLCFFDGCNLRMLTNFSRHIAKHERKNDRIKPDLVNLIPSSPYNGPTTPIRRTHSSPTSPTTCSSNFSPLLNNNNNNHHNHHHHSNNNLNGNGNNNNNGGSASSTPICQSPLTSSSQPFGSPTQQSANDNQSKLKRKLHVKVNSSPNRNSENNNNNNNNINSNNNSSINTSNRDMTNLISPHSEPCTPTSHKITSFSCSPSFSSHHLNSTRESGIISIVDSKSKGKVDSLIAGDNYCSILSSPSSSSLLLSPTTSDFSAVPTSPTSPLRSSRMYNNSNNNNNINNNNNNGNNNNNNNSSSPLSPISQSTPSFVTSPIILSTLSMNSPVSTSQNSQQQQTQISQQSLSATNLLEATAVPVAPQSPTSAPNAAGGVVVNNSSNTTTITKSLFRNSEIQWEFRSPAKKLPLSPTSSPVSPFQSSVVPLSTSSSTNAFNSNGKSSKNKDDEMVVKSLLDLSQSDF